MKTENPKPRRGASDKGKPKRSSRKNEGQGSEKPKPIRQSGRKDKQQESRPERSRPYGTGRAGEEKPKTYRPRTKPFDANEEKPSGVTRRPRQSPRDTQQGERPERTRPYTSHRADEDKPRAYRPRTKPSDSNEEKPSGITRRPRQSPRDTQQGERPERTRPYASNRADEDKPRAYRARVKPGDVNEERPLRKKYDSPGSDRKPEKPAGKRRLPANPDTDTTIRLNKYIANAGVCSRREADKLIETGAVRVNGVIVTELGTKVSPHDKIQLGDQTLSTEKIKYVLLNKPKGYISTVDDPFKRNTVMQLVKDACRERIYPVGRLDRNTTGLLLFTNDGDLTRRLTHPRFGVRKIYDVELDKSLAKGDFDTIATGINLDGETVIIDEIAYVEFEKDKKHIGIELHSGQNHVVRRIFEKFEYKVMKLDRVMFGPLTKKNLPRGHWRFLTDTEIRLLKKL